MTPQVEERKEKKERKENDENKNTNLTPLFRSDAGYTHLLAVVSTLILGQNTKLSSPRDSSTPNSWALVMNFLHSLTYWTHFFCIWGCIMTYYFSLQFEIERIDVQTPSYLFFVGCLTYMLQTVVEGIPFFFEYYIYGTIIDRIGSYISYSLIHYIFMFSTPFFVYHYYMFAKRERELVSEKTK